MILAPRIDCQPLLTPVTLPFQLSMIQSKKRHEVLDCLTSLVNAFGIFFKEGSDLFSQVEPETKEVAADVVEMKRLSSLLEKHLEKNHFELSDLESRKAFAILTLVQETTLAFDATGNRQTHHLTKNFHYEALC